MDNGMQFERHEMVVTQEYENGAREFYCPTCGRRFIIQWPPAYKRIILAEGDTDALHTGGSEGMVVDSTPVESEETFINDLTGSDNDPYLAPWMKYIEQYLDL